MFNELLQRGYFPQELPPPFRSNSLAKAITSQISSLSHPFICDPKKSKKQQFISHSGKLNLARAGTLRRVLSLPNPINYIQLAYVVDSEWQQLVQHINQSNISLSKPILTPGKSRAIKRFKDFRDLSEIRAVSRAKCRYTLITDINTFYPSIYTHSIPWAIHSKTIAKAQRGYHESLGNKLDALIRNAQDQQTKGIPIGPDTSLIVAEAILTVVDKELENEFSSIQGFRYVDDYELCFWSLADAETALFLLQESLAQFELQLNPNKTKIIELPHRIEPKWVAELRMFEFRAGAKAQHTDIIHFFDCAFGLRDLYREEAVLKYAVSTSRAIQVPEENWPLYEAFLLQCCIAEAETLPVVIELLRNYSINGFNLNKDSIRETFARIVELHAPRGHGSEVASVVWGSLVLQLPIDDETANLIGKMNDSVVALLTLDARAKGLIRKTINFDLWNQYMTRQELRGPNWLLCYQAYENGWLASVDSTDYINQDPEFSFLRTHKVKFYDEQSSVQVSTSSDMTAPSITYTGGY